MMIEYRGGRLALSQLTEITPRNNSRYTQEYRHKNFIYGYLPPIKSYHSPPILYLKKSLLNLPPVARQIWDADAIMNTPVDHQSRKVSQVLHQPRHPSNPISLKFEGKEKGQK